MKKIIALVAALCLGPAFANFYSNGTRIEESKLDVVVLMDYSGSMISFANRSALVRGIIEKTTQNSLNIGLIVNGPLGPNETLFRTTPVNGELSKVLDGLMSDINSLGNNGPATEEFYSSLLKTTEAKFSDFYRPGAEVKFIVVTDEDEDQASGMSTFDFIREIKGRLDLGKVGMDLVTPTGECRNDWNGPLNEMILYQGVQALGGAVYDLCQGI